METNHLPVIDWELGTKLAGDKRELAEDMLQLLMKNLEYDISSITTLSKDKNYQQMLSQVHKLHGAICYCGLPRLRLVLAQLERVLKNNIMDGLPSLLNQLNTEVHLLLEHYSCQS